MVVTIITIKNSSTIHFAAFMGIVYLSVNTSGEKISLLNVAQCPTKAEHLTSLNSQVAKYHCSLIRE